MSHWLQVVVAAPAHSVIAGPLTYKSATALEPGTLVRVPFGRREVLGVVWKALPDSGGVPEETLRDIAGALDGLAPLPATWRQLVTFTAHYYARHQSCRKYYGFSSTQRPADVRIGRI